MESKQPELAYYKNLDRMDLDFKKKLFRGIQYKPVRKRFFRERRMKTFGDSCGDDPFGLGEIGCVGRGGVEGMRLGGVEEGKNGNGGKEREWRCGKKMKSGNTEVSGLADSFVPEGNNRDWLNESVAGKKELRTTSPRKKTQRSKNGPIQEIIQADLGKKQKKLKDIWKKVMSNVSSKRKLNSIRSQMSIIDPPGAGHQQNVFIASKKSLLKLGVDVSKIHKENRTSL
jgi:hypothetical protein